MSDSSWRIAQFQPPARPEWVRRINEEGRCLDLANVVPLDAESLLRSAMKRIGHSTTATITLIIGKAERQP